MTTTVDPVRPVTASSRPPAGMMVVAAIVIAAAITAIVVAGLLVRDTIWMLQIDFKVYHVAGAAVLNGVSPYDAATMDGLQFIYPPLTALFFAPLGLMSVDVAFAVWTFLSVLALMASVWLALRLVPSLSPSRRAKSALLATVIALPTAPVLMHLGVGQVGVWLMLLVLIDLTRKPGRSQGFAIGLAAGLKLIPLIFIVYFLITGRIRAAVVSGVTFVATVLVGWLLMSGPSARWWGELWLDTGRMVPDGAVPFNVSMRGVLGQLPGFLSATWFWLTLAVLVGLAGLAVSAWASRRGLEAAGIFACAVTSLLVSPISWSDHWVWVVPGFAILVLSVRRGHAARTWVVPLVWLVLTLHAVLIAMIVVGVADPADARALMPVAPEFLLMVSGLSLLGGLAYLGTVATILRRGEDHRVTTPA